jgi:hypothetical protein
MKILTAMSILGFAFTAVLFSSCRTEEGGLMKAIDKAEVKSLKDTYGDPGQLANAITAVKQSRNPEQRNDLLNDLIRAIDLNYYHWEKLLYDKKSFSDFGIDTAVLGLGSAGTYGVADSTVKVLSAISGSLTGTRAAFDSNVLQKQAIPAVIAKMRALRAQGMKDLQNGMMEQVGQRYAPRPWREYSVTQGLNDLVAYYNAGTFVGAIAVIQADAGKQQKDAEATTPTASAPKPTPTPSP